MVVNDFRETRDNILMDQVIISIMARLSLTRSTVYSVEFLSLIPEAHRMTTLTNFFNSETQFFNLIQSIEQHQLNSTANIILSWANQPLLPVIVTATPERINEVVVAHTPAEESNCAVCQDVIATNGVRLQTCNHLFHNDCIRTWFNSSVKCPVCLQDIREEDQGSETSSDESEMTSQLQDL